MRDAWRDGESYERYIGRWSREVARMFVSDLSIAPGSDWIDVGCGSGALTAAILKTLKPKPTTKKKQAASAKRRRT
ncbi:MAG: hypothetical protein ACXVJO_09195 [Thermoanaerobaculia bacterium]